MDPHELAHNVPLSLIQSWSCVKDSALYKYPDADLPPGRYDFADDIPENYFFVTLRIHTAKVVPGLSAAQCAAIAYFAIREDVVTLRFTDSPGVFAHLSRSERFSRGYAALCALPGGDGGASWITVSFDDFVKEAVHCFQSIPGLTAFNLRPVERSASVSAPRNLFSRYTTSAARGPLAPSAGPVGEGGSNSSAAPGSAVLPNLSLPLGRSIESAAAGLVTALREFEGGDNGDISAGFSTIIPHLSVPQGRTLVSAAAGFIQELPTSTASHVNDDSVSAVLPHMSLPPGRSLMSAAAGLIVELGALAADGSSVAANSSEAAFDPAPISRMNSTQVAKSTSTPLTVTFAGPISQGKDVTKKTAEAGVQAVAVGVQVCERSVQTDNNSSSGSFVRDSGVQGSADEATSDDPGLGSTGGGDFPLKKVASSKRRTSNTTSSEPTRRSARLSAPKSTKGSPAAGMSMGAGTTRTQGGSDPSAAATKLGGVKRTASAGTTEGGQLKKRKVQKENVQPERRQSTRLKTLSG